MELLVLTGLLAMQKGIITGEAVEDALFRPRRVASATGRDQIRNIEARQPNTTTHCHDLRAYEAQRRALELEIAGLRIDNELAVRELILPRSPPAITIRLEFRDGEEMAARRETMASHGREPQQERAARQLMAAPQDTAYIPGREITAQLPPERPTIILERYMNEPPPSQSPASDQSSQMGNIPAPPYALSNGEARRSYEG